MLWTPRYGDEVRPEAEYLAGLEKARVDKARVDKDLLKLVETRKADWSPGFVADPVQYRLVEIIKANPGLSEAAIAVTCDRTRLSEVRICMTKSLQFRACDEIDRRACRRGTVSMPPVRGG